MPFHDKQFFEYLPVSDDDIAWGLYVTGVGEATIGPKAEYPPPGHPALYQFDFKRGRILPEYQIIYIIAGAGTFESKPTGKVAVPTGSIILLFPDVWHRYKPIPNVGWSSYWVSLNGQFLYHLAERSIISPKLAVVNTGLRDTILKPFRQLIARVKDQPTRNSLYLSALAIEILACIVETGSADLSTRNKAATSAVKDSLIDRAIEFIWNRSHRRISVSAVADALPTTRRTLERRFRAATGRTVAQEIIGCRVERAKHLLRETNIPIKQIAFKVGFNSPERMSKVFRRELNTTPGSYRRTNHYKPRIHR